MIHLLEESLKDNKHRVDYLQSTRTCDDEFDKFLQKRDRLYSLIPTKNKLTSPYLNYNSFNETADSKVFLPVGSELPQQKNESYERITSNHINLNTSHSPQGPIQIIPQLLGLDSSGRLVLLPMTGSPYNTSMLKESINNNTVLSMHQQTNDNINQSGLQNNTFVNAAFSPNSESVSHQNKPMASNERFIDASNIPYYAQNNTNPTSTPQNVMTRQPSENRQSPVGEPRKTPVPYTSNATQNNVFVDTRHESFDASHENIIQNGQLLKRDSFHSSDNNNNVIVNESFHIISQRDLLTKLNVNVTSDKAVDIPTKENSSNFHDNKPISLIHKNSENSQHSNNNYKNENTDDPLFDNTKEKSTSILDRQSSSLSWHQTSDCTDDNKANKTNKVVKNERLMKNDDAFSLAHSNPLSNDKATKKSVSDIQAIPEKVSVLNTQNNLKSSSNLTNSLENQLSENDLNDLGDSLAENSSIINFSNDISDFDLPSKADEKNGTEEEIPVNNLNSNSLLEHQSERISPERETIQIKKNSEKAKDNGDNRHNINKEVSATNLDSLPNSEHQSEESETKANNNKVHDKIIDNGALFYLIDKLNDVIEDNHVESLVLNLDLNEKLSSKIIRYVEFIIHQD